MKTATIASSISALTLIVGCAAPARYVGVNGDAGYGGVSFQQAHAECDYQAETAMRAALDRTRGGVFSGMEARAETMRGCMSSKGFRAAR